MLTGRVVAHDLRWLRVARHRDDRGHMIELSDHRSGRNTVQLGHDDILRDKSVPYQKKGRVRGSPYHENQVVLLQVHLVHGADTIYGNVDCASKDLQELAREFPADRIVFDQQNPRRNRPPGYVS